MKIKKLLYLLFLSAVLTTLTSCSSDNDYDLEYPYDSIEDGTRFSRANTVRFYYIDNEGRSLINPEDLTTLPISYNNDEQLPEAKIIPEDYNDGLYNGNHNTVMYDSEEKLYYLQSIAYGHMKQPTYTFYIGFKDEFDKMKVTYKYTDKNVLGGQYYAKIISWKFNGVHIYSDDDPQFKKVFIKKANGKTTVSFKR